MLAFVVAYSLELDSVVRLLYNFFNFAQSLLPIFYMALRSLELLFAAPSIVVCPW